MTKGRARNKLTKRSLTGKGPPKPYRVTARGHVYYYAWRGGPRLPDAGDPAFTAAFAAALADRKAPATPTTIAALLDLYEVSPEFGALAPSTAKIRKLRLAAIREDRIGKMPLLALEARAAPAAIIRFRDARAKTPRAADEHVEALSVALNWGIARGWLLRNPAARVPALYRRGAHAAMIWDQSTFEAVQPHLTTPARQAVALAAATGLRRGDLVSLDWDQIDRARAMIRKPTGKSRGRTVAWIPLSGDALAVLDAIGWQSTGPVLRAQKGARWLAAELTSQVHAALKAIGSDLRLHDLRGTYATLLFAAGVSHEEIEERMGWESGQARKRRRDYVREESVTEALAKALVGFAGKAD
ncbi:MAG: tyrosine-type recombinase/integrase [Bosea sp. (in: a-proteobacteria)]